MVAQLLMITTSMSEVASPSRPHSKVTVSIEKQSVIPFPLKLTINLNRLVNNSKFSLPIIGHLADVIIIGNCRPGQGLLVFVVVVMFH